MAPKASPKPCRPRDLTGKTWRALGYNIPRKESEGKKAKKKKRLKMAPQWSGGWRVARGSLCQGKCQMAINTTPLRGGPYKTGNGGWGT